MGEKYDFSYATGDNKKTLFIVGIIESGNKGGNMLILPPTGLLTNKRKRLEI